MRYNHVAKATILLLALIIIGQSAWAQLLTSTDVPKIISYQGKLTDAGGGALPDGKYTLKVSLYSDDQGVNRIWTWTEEAVVNYGIFNLLLGAKRALPELEKLSQPIFIGISVNGTDELRPLTLLTSSPYALNVADKSITKAKLADDVIQLMYYGNRTQNKQTLLDDPCTTNDDNSITTNTIGGGCGNIVSDGLSGPSFSAIFGGEDNKVISNHSFIGGGYNNKITAGDRSVISGGDTNTIMGSHSVIGGGKRNVIESKMSVISGGQENLISEDTRFSTIGGGWFNLINGFEPAEGFGFFGTIGGGRDNKIFDPYGTIAGGRENSLEGENSTIAGGYSNVTNVDFASIGGGHINHITDDGLFSTIAGGNQNRIEGEYAFIGGGGTEFTSILFGNRTKGNFTVITGGKENFIDGTGVTSFASVISGGEINRIIESNHSVISGGEENIIEDFHPYSTISGGRKNSITGSEAKSNSIGGGNSNVIKDSDNPTSHATIPGGDNLIAQSYAQTVVGYFNKAEGNVVKWEGEDFFIDIQEPHQPLFIVGNGLNNDNRNNAFWVSYDGHSVVTDINNRGRKQPPVGFNPLFDNAVIKGATYVDNIIYAWGDVNSNGSINNDFGVYDVVRISNGKYLIILNQCLQDLSQRLIQNISVTATLSDSVTPTWEEAIDTLAYPSNIYCASIYTTRAFMFPSTHPFSGGINRTAFIIYTLASGVGEVLPCHYIDRHFMFHVTGR